MRPVTHFGAHGVLPKRSHAYVLRGSGDTILCGVTIFLFWKLPPGSGWLANTALLCAAGFFIYGPQCLIGVMAANLATKRAAATAVGLTGIFGYASTVLSGWGMGWLVEHYGWSIGFELLIAVAFIGMILFATTWNAKPHGYAGTN